MRRWTFPMTGAAKHLLMCSPNICILFWRNFCSGSLPILNLSFTYSGYSSLTEYMTYKYLFSLFGLSFYSHLFLTLENYLYNYMSVYMHVLRWLLSPLMWVLGTQLQLSERVASTLNLAHLSNPLLLSFPNCPLLPKLVLGIKSRDCADKASIDMLYNCQPPPLSAGGQTQSCTC